MTSLHQLFCNEKGETHQLYPSSIQGNKTKEVNKKKACEKNTYVRTLSLNDGSMEEMKDMHSIMTIK